MSKSHGIKIKIAVLCGGPSPERGISLNSARSACDHIASDLIEIVPIYFDLEKRPYLISRGQLYSNTPSDFDFKIKKTAQPLSQAQLGKLLKGVDVAFPVMHGQFGEDGGVQRLLEKYNCPYVGTPAAACELCFDKYDSAKRLEKLGIQTLPSILIKRGERDAERKIKNFFSKYKLKRAIVKPTLGGSSIGVRAATSPSEAALVAKELLSGSDYNRVIVEKFCEGVEFTSIILENKNGREVCLLPVEIETDYRNNQIFDFRKKYLPTHQVRYHCPPRFSAETIKQIQKRAERIFKVFGMRDFARLDGWLLKNGDIIFSDFNTISGMEQNSFLFLQSAQLGMSHHDVLQCILKSCFRRNNKKFPEPPRRSKASAKRRRVNVIFGGNTAERQVSLMSGTNVWLKLKNSMRYDSHPYLLDMSGNVWELPYYATLNHTVDEISEVCKRARSLEKNSRKMREEVISKLSLSESELSERPFLPRKMSMAEFLKESDLVLNGLHGGFGEGGEIQSLFEKNGIAFNGSGSEASRLGMDKFNTGQAISNLTKHGIRSAAKLRFGITEIKKQFPKSTSKWWEQLTKKLRCSSIIVKPNDDGCSAGIVRLSSQKDLKAYLSILLSGAGQIPPNTISRQSEIIEMPTEIPSAILFEEFIETDRISVVGQELRWKTVSGWIEVTVGVLGPQGKMKALNPSITVASSDVLSVEEKFQGGTGVNITPPPTKYVSTKVLDKVKKRIEIAAAALGLEGYARIDAFINIKNGEVLVIEANTLPGLTASTVLFHQALLERPSLNPRALLEKILDLALEARKRRETARVFDRKTTSKKATDSHGKSQRQKSATTSGKKKVTKIVTAKIKQKSNSRTGQTSTRLQKQTANTR